MARSERSRQLQQALKALRSRCPRERDDGVRTITPYVDTIVINRRKPYQLHNDDVIQLALMALVSAAERYDARRPAEPWIMRITRNVFHSELLRINTYHHKPPGGNYPASLDYELYAGVTGHDVAASSTLTPNDTVIADETRRIAARAVAGLRDHLSAIEWKAITEYLLPGRSYNGKKSVDNAIFRARQKLRRLQDRKGGRDEVIKYLAAGSPI